MLMGFEGGDGHEGRGWGGGLIEAGGAMKGRGGG